MSIQKDLLISANATMSLLVSVKKKTHLSHVGGQNNTLMCFFVLYFRASNSLHTVGSEEIQTGFWKSCCQ